MSRITLREYGVYALPDRREFVVRLSGRNEYSLYPSLTRNGFRMAEYRINSEGRVLSKGTPTRWRAADLIDTGRTINRPPAVANALL
ncbi:MAG: hypothetical protein QOH63_960 [Acidobacteriota bacterium]|jgi:hypothetical protein|nr:hypothetical protein [Acidobacteriota bacterium]